jgi:hypothetical protein
VTFAEAHPAFGIVTFVFDDHLAKSGFAQTDGFVFLGVEYPTFAFAFEREGSGFVSGELNNRTSQIVNGRRRTISEIAPSAFRFFVLSKAKELAIRLRGRPQRSAGREFCSGSSTDTVTSHCVEDFREG